MIHVRPLLPRDFEVLAPRLQPAQRTAAAWLRPPLALDCLDRGPAWTAESGQGRVLACAGVYVLGWRWPVAWALLAAEAGAHLLALTRAVRRHLDPFPVLATGVRDDFPAGRRWARLLGFAPEPVELFPDHRLWLRRAPPAGTAAARGTARGERAA